MIYGLSFVPEVEKDVIALRHFDMIKARQQALLPGF
jgi:hypothetical protein